MSASLELLPEMAEPAWMGGPLASRRDPSAFPPLVSVC